MSSFRIDFISITVVPRDLRHGILGRATNSQLPSFLAPLEFVHLVFLIIRFSHAALWAGCVVQ